VQAGPDGHILLSTGREIRILDSEFSVVQTIASVNEDDSTWKLTRHWTGAIIVAPSRHGFLIHESYPPYRVGYFEGDPAKQVLVADSCPGGIAVADGGFACGRPPADSDRLAILVGKSEWHVDDELLRRARALALLAPQTLLVLTDKLQLYEFDAPTAKEKVADLRWLAPGWNSGFRYELASATARRILSSAMGLNSLSRTRTGLGNISE
jgi:hypothetical protein